MKDVCKFDISISNLKKEFFLKLLTFSLGSENYLNCIKYIIRKLFMIVMKISNRI
jgi:hypothetical protein